VTWTPEEQAAHMGIADGLHDVDDTLEAAVFYDLGFSLIYGKAPPSSLLGHNVYSGPAGTTYFKKEQQ